MMDILSNNNSAIGPAVKRRLDDLYHLSHRLRSRGLLITYFTFLVIILLAANGIVKSLPFVRIVPFSISIVCIILAFVGLLFLFTWERIKNYGMILYEEISDEVEWTHRTFRPRHSHPEKEANTSYERPSLDIRLILRKFLNSARLPLVPADYCTLVYSFILLVCVIASILMLPRSYF